MNQPASEAAALDNLRHAIEHASHLLPSQGPIRVFVHHNTLHALEDLPFEKAVAAAAKTFGCQPYMSESFFHEQLTQGRIRPVDLETVLRDDLGDAGEEVVAGLTRRFDLRLAMLMHPVRLGPDAELRWLVAETDALQRFREDVPAETRHHVVEETRRWTMRDLCNGNGSESGRVVAIKELVKQFGESSIERWSDVAWEAFCLQAMWRICRQGVHGVERFSPAPAPALRLRDWLLEATGQDSDLLVNDLLIHFCAAFLDQGLAPWSLPARDEGFYASFLHLYGRARLAPEGWLRELSHELSRLGDNHIGPLESIRESLDLLGVDKDEQEHFISATLLTLRGWAGMIWQLETRGDRVAHPAPVGSLVEFLAIRLVLDRLAASHIAKTSLGYNGSLSELRNAAAVKIARPEAVSVDQRAFLVFQVAQFLGWRPADLVELSPQQWSALVKELESFSSLDRRRVFQLAYERHYYTQALDAVSIQTRHRQRPAGTPRFQLLTCIDDREESFRRHLEEVAPDVETFGAAAFYGVAMYYRGAADAHYTPLCPIIIRPEHWVREDVVYMFEDAHRRRTKTRRFLGMASHRLHLGSRSFLGGAFVAGLGSLASIPLVARVLFPRLTSQFLKSVGRLVSVPPVTQLQLERVESDESEADEEHLGFTLDEMVNIVAHLLQDIGLTANFSRLVILLGHGSSSLNNPHESAYNCGACAGGRGGPNARAFARMANDPRVRTQLLGRGIELTENVYFVGGYHNTCDDSVIFYDLDRLPPTHRDDLDGAADDIDKARELNAHERCRRFESAPLNLSAEAALRHVEARSEDLAQTRPNTTTPPTRWQLLAAAS